jgi:hypothetical protein
MQKESTLDSLRRKLSAIAASGGSPLDAYDFDRFLVRLPLRYYDSDLDSPPTVQQVNTLVKLGVPRWPLINQGTVNETWALLEARRSKGLASVPQARLCATEGTPAPGLLNLPKSGPSYTTSGGKN